MVRRDCISFFLGYADVADVGPVFLDAPGNKLERSVQKRPLRLRVSSDAAIIQVSTSAGVVRITGIALGWIAPTSEFGSVVRNVKRSLVVSPSVRKLPTSGYPISQTP